QPLCSYSTVSPTQPVRCDIIASREGTCGCEECRFQISSLHTDSNLRGISVFEYLHLHGHLIYEYDGKPLESKSPLQGRLQWTGSKDLQDVSITILNVTTNDSGLFTCYVNRTLHFEAHRHLTQSKKSITLKVTEEAGEDFTSVLSEIMMYFLLAFLTFWLLVEVVYCYRKISKAEEVTQESVTDYLAIPSENKENCSVPVEE
uniref:Sodium channel regulatory subunit beta-3 n=1 Tax=Xenopus tropicalis TaxID=8364 RepID=A0A803KFJ4_XENTR